MAIENFNSLFTLIKNEVFIIFTNNDFASLYIFI